MNHKLLARTTSNARGLSPWGVRKLRELDELYKERDDEPIVGDAALEFALDAQHHLARYRPLAQWLAQEAPNARQVLDLGCGPGVLSEIVAKALPEAQVTGVDVSHDMLSIAQTRAFDRLSFVHADAREGSEVALRPVDAVISRRMLHRADGLETMIEDMAKPVSDRGFLVNYSFRRPDDDESLRVFLESAKLRSNLPALHQAFVRAVIHAPTLAEYRQAVENVARRIDAKRVEMRVLPFDIAFLISK